MADVKSKLREALTYQKIFNAVPNLMAVSSLEDGTYLEVNDEFIRATGYTREDIVGKTAIELGIAVDTSYRDKMKSGLEKNGSFRNLDVNIRLKDEKLRAGLLSGEVFEADGQQRLLTVWTDITERKQAEAAVHEAYELNEIIISASPIGLSIYDHTGQCIGANTSIAELVGATLEQVLAQNYNNIASWKQSGLLDAANKCIRLQEKERHEFDLVTTFGKHAFYDCLFTPFKLHGEQHLFLMIDDISERKQAETVLQKADELKDSFMSTITHELLTPLNGVQLSHALLEAKVPESGKEYLDMAKTSNRHMQHLVESMITFTEARKGTLVIHKKPFPIKSTLRNIFDHFERSNNKKTINYKIGFNSNVPDWILSDEKKLSIIVVQLMKNAVAFTQQGEVVLSCSSVTREQSDQYLVISVQDTGMGISDKVQKSIFDAFSQADSSITREHGGLGIGLTNVKDILNLMGGQLDVESEIGSGSTFTITIPITLATELQIREAQRLPAAQGVVVSPEESTQFENAKILVVEDNPVNMTLMLRVLEKANYQTLSAVHGEEALAILKDNADVAAVLMDCQMPVMDGFEATRQIRQMPGFEDLPIIAVTANIAEDDQQRCWDAGMSDYLAKPASRTLIEKTLVKWLGKTHQQ